jgi:hypothetical protein
LKHSSPDTANHFPCLQAGMYDLQTNKRLDKLCQL